MALDLSLHVREQSARFAASLRDVDPTTRVPSCPDWDAAALLWHLTEVHHMWAAVVAGRITDEAAVEAVETSAPERPDRYDDLFAVYERTTDDLLVALAGASDDTPVWTWAPDQNVGFVRRFQAHEALMHRVDAELTAGNLTPLPAELAADGIDVVTRYSMTWRPGWASWALSGAVGLLHATDTDTRVTVGLGAWSGTSPDTGKTYEATLAIELLDDSSTPTFTVSAPAADLDAWLWHRPGFGAVTVTGDDPDYRRFAGLVEAGVQ